VARGRISAIVGDVQNAAERIEIISITGRAILPASKEFAMHINLSLAPIVALVAGILILVMPKLLNYIIALYLIVVGLLGLFGTGGSFHFR
jgi:Protein of unknown function (DUF3096)